MSNIIANKGTVLYLVAVMLVVIFACGQAVFVLPVNQPSVSVQLTAGYCPSIEVQEGMRIAWTNQDKIDHSLVLQCENGFCENHRLQPGDTISLSLRNTGQYTYYCSSNQQMAGTITVRK